MSKIGLLTCIDRKEYCTLFSHDIKEDEHYKYDKILDFDVLIHFSKNKWTKAHEKAYNGKLTVLDMKKILDEIHTVDVYDSYYQTPMWWACWRGNYELYKLLKQYGSNLEQKDVNGWTLLDAVVLGNGLHGSEKIIQDLLVNGLDPYKKDLFKNSTIDRLQYKKNKLTLKNIALDKRNKNILREIENYNSRKKIILSKL